jgi:hypothetical protein
LFINRIKDYKNNIFRVILSCIFIALFISIPILKNNIKIENEKKEEIIKLELEKSEQIEEEYRIAKEIKEEERRIAKEIEEEKQIKIENTFIKVSFDSLT